MSDSTSEQVVQLRRAMRDLVALSTLPAIWTADRPEGIARSLADVLVTMLDLDLVYLQLRGQAAGTEEGGMVEVVRGPRTTSAGEEAREIGQSLAPLLEAGRHECATVRDPFGDATLRTAMTRFGHSGDFGVLVAASRRPDFPIETERLLLGVGANQTALVLRRKYAEQAVHKEREWLRVTLRSIGDAVIATDASGRVNSMNPIAEQLTGWTLAEARGQPLETVFRIVNEFTGRPVENPAERALREGAIVGLANHTLLIAKDGAGKPIDDSAAPIRDGLGAVVGVVLVFRDVTERRRAEAELETSHVRTASILEAIAAKLSDADRRKDEFLATLAHELRNPLAAVRTGLELMRMAADDRPVVEDARAAMEAQTHQLVRLVDDLLDVSRITTGKITLRRERVELASIVAMAIDATRAVLDESGHELTVTLPPQPVLLDADSTRLVQILSNLLTNAARYTVNPGRIRLTAQRQGSEAVVTVNDTGIGIPADMLDRVFDMFTQVDRSLERSHSGLGIGLTLVKRLVEMHGGSVEAHSEGPGKGSEFAVRLPVLIEQATEPKPINDESAAPLARRRILVVDDNEDAAEMLGIVVKMLGNETRTAHDGLEAVEVAAEFRPDIVLMDIGMPRLNGYDAARRMREQPWGQGLLLVALTGWGQDDDKQRTKDAGFDHHLVKPVEPAALRRLLASQQPPR